MASNPVVFLAAGEPSGDLHAAHLVTSLANQNLQFYAMGGKQLAQAGAKIVVDSTELAVVGLVEIISKLKLIRQAFKKVLQAIAIHKPKVVILVDYPGFNLRLAKKIKQKDPTTKILYYISPQIWAWRYKRVKQIKHYVDLMAVIFPFEVPIYEKENIPVKFVDHPLIAQVKISQPTETTRHLLGLGQQAKVIGLMPGSRKSELKYLLPTLLKAVKQLKKQYPELHFLLLLAPNLQESNLQPYLAKTSLKIPVVASNYDTIAACDALIVTSGTATLEVGLLCKPMVTVYKLSYFTYRIGKFLVKVPHIGLCNIVAGERIVKELLQMAASPKNIANEVVKLLFDNNYANQIRKKLKQMHTTFTQHNSVENLSSIVADLVD